MTIKIKKISLEEIMKINKKIPEFKKETIQQFKKRLGKKKNCLLGCYLDDKEAGYLVGYALNKKEFYIWIAGTIPKHRKKGIMKKLMDQIEKKAKSEGYEKIKLKTRNTRRAQLINLVNRNYMFTKIEKGPELKENRIYLEKIL
jgi:ribosomal protein S18 acetylase RimI-like enzyme